MKLVNIKQQIDSVDSWGEKAGPKKKNIQWKSGYSAMELAKYFVKSLPDMPREIEDILLQFTDKDAVFEWQGECETKLPGEGEGRNHDLFMWGKDIVVGVEAKVKESLGNYIKDEIEGASVNKLGRISALLKMFFDDGFKEYGDLRYQLLTAAAGTIIEAQKREKDKALLLVIVFKPSNVRAVSKTDEKESQHDIDIDKFLKAVHHSRESKGCKTIPNKTGVKLYFKKIEIEVPFDNGKTVSKG